jgi:hypothetical protein
MHPLEPLNDVGHDKSSFDRLETVLVSVLDRCMVYAKHTIGSKIILDAPNLLLGDEAQVEAHFGPFRESANLDVR